MTRLRRQPRVIEATQCQEDGLRIVTSVQLFLNSCPGETREGCVTATPRRSFIRREPGRYATSPRPDRDFQEAAALAAAPLSGPVWTRSAAQTVPASGHRPGGPSRALTWRPRLLEPLLAGFQSGRRQ